MIETKPTTNGRPPPTLPAAAEPTAGPRKMSAHRKTSLAAGVLYLLTFVSVPTLFLYGPVKGANYILGAGPDTNFVIGGMLEMIVALAGIGTAAALFPVLKRQNEGLALGFVGVRALEAATIVAGVVMLLTVVGLRQGGAGASELPLARTLVAMYNHTFLLGQSTMPIVDDLLLGFLLYQSRLVPRILPALAFIGAPLLLASNVGVLFSLWGQFSTLGTIPALPIALFEFSLGIYLIARGFRPAAISALYGRSAGENSAFLASVAPVR
jgi:hypothetical protein